MVEIWFAIFWIMAGVYVILDGRTLGASALRLAVSSNPEERRQVLDAIGPAWSLYEVWLISAGGVLLLAFPPVFAVAFSGYYLALFLILWLLVLRGISIEIGRHLQHPLWSTFWDFIMTVSSASLILLFGVALGNIMRGVPLDEHGEFHMAFFTDFGVRGQVGLIDWYTLSVGLFAMSVLMAHGATFLMRRSSGPVRDRSRIAGQFFWFATLPIGMAIAFETRSVCPDLWTALVSRPWSVVFLLVAALGAIAIVRGFRAHRHGLAFAGSCAVIAGVLAARAAAAFPVLLYSTLDPERSISAYQAAARHESLSIALVWWTIGAALTVLWHILAGRSCRGSLGMSKVSEDFEKLPRLDLNQ